jgi:hypothetical protein
MSLAVYLDECVNRRLADALRERGLRATAAVDEHTLGLDDEAQLLFATRRGFVILSHNQRHFQQLHVRFEAEERPHGGILLLPPSPLPLVTLRTAMLVNWVEAHSTTASLLARWHELQGHILAGLRLPGFSETEIRRALTIEPMSI